jgi:ribosomal protein S19E (S16A)
MKPQVDRILEGVRPSEVAQLQALAAGQMLPDPLRALEDKGWVETVAGTPLITLTGRTLLDGASGR